MRHCGYGFGCDQPVTTRYARPPAYKAMYLCTEHAERMKEQRSKLPTTTTYNDHWAAYKPSIDH